MTLGALLLRTTLFFAIGAVIMVLGSFRKPDEVQRERAAKFIGFFVIVHGVLLLGYVGTPALIALAVVIVAIGAWEARRAWRLMPEPRPTLLVTAGLATAVAFGYVAARGDSAAIAWLFLVSASFDGLGQVVGQLLGRHLLAPSTSPAKTVEGLIGAMAGAVLVAIALRTLPGYSVPRATALGVAVGVASLIGDLAGSWTKRRAGIKDFSSLLPGQGGVLDRFNSFMVAMALVGAWL